MGYFCLQRKNKQILVGIFAFKCDIFVSNQLCKHVFVTGWDFATRANYANELLFFRVGGWVNPAGRQEVKREGRWVMKVAAVTTRLIERGEGG